MSYSRNCFKGAYIGELERGLLGTHGQQDTTSFGIWVQGFGKDTIFQMKDSLNSLMGSILGDYSGDYYRAY